MRGPGGRGWGQSEVSLGQVCVPSPPPAFPPLPQGKNAQIFWSVYVLTSGNPTKNTCFVIAPAFVLSVCCLDVLSHSLSRLEPVRDTRLHSAAVMFVKDFQRIITWPTRVRGQTGDIACVNNDQLFPNQIRYDSFNSHMNVSHSLCWCFGDVKF